MSVIHDTVVQRLSEAYKKGKAAKSSTNAQEKVSSSSVPPTMSTPATQPPSHPPQRNERVMVSVPLAPHPSDQVTPSSRSPREAVTSSGDNLRSSLRQVADALAQTVASVQNAQEVVRGEFNEDEREETSEMEFALERTEGEGVTFERENVGVSEIAGLIMGNPPAASNTSESQNVFVASVGPANTTQTASFSISSYPPQPSPSSLPLPTFDGSQESAVTTLASTDPSDPLHTFFSAIARAHPPPLQRLSPTAQSQSTTTTTSTSTSVSLRLPIFTQFNQQLRTDSTTNTESHSGCRLEPIPAPSQASVTNPEDAPNPFVTGIISGALEASRRAMQQVSSDTQQPNMSQRSSQSQEQADARTSNLAEELVRVVSQLVPTPSSTSSSSTPHLSLGAGGSVVHSPSPSDSLVPLLMSSLQLPVSSASTSGSGSRDVTETGTTDGSPSSGIAENVITSTTATDEGRDPPAHVSAEGEDVGEGSQAVPKLFARFFTDVSHPTRDDEPHASSVAEQQQHRHEPELHEGEFSIAITTISIVPVSSPSTVAVVTLSSGEVAGNVNPILPSSTGLVETFLTSSASTSTSPPPPPLVPFTASTSITSTISAQTSSSQAQAATTLTPIDPAFLAALPDTIRQEVVAQHEREQRMFRARQETNFSTTISPEFLAALPTNIQEEVCIAI